jgi:hypothetical protein
VFETKATLAAPFKEYRDTVRKCSADFGRIDPIERPFLEDPKIGPIYKNVRNILKHHRDFAIDDHWGHLLRRSNLGDHEVLGKTVRNKDWSESQNLHLALDESRANLR